MAELVFLHGAADSGVVWEHQTQYFGPHHDVLALDLPGHGARLNETALHTVADIAVEAVRAARACGMTQPVLVGHSMGGATALQIALTEPDFPKALVLAGSGVRLKMRDELVAEAGRVAETSPPGQLVKRIVKLEEAISPAAPSEIQEWLAQRFGQATGQGVYGDFRATSTFDLMDRVAEIRLPTLIIAGKDDRWTPPKFQHFMAERIPGSRLVMLQDTGHYPFVERADRFNEELDRFLTEL